MGYDKQRIAKRKSFMQSINKCLDDLNPHPADQPGTHLA